MGMVLVLASAIAFGACGSASAGLLTSTVPLGQKRYKVLRQAKTTVSWLEPNFILFNWPGSVPMDEARKQLLEPTAGTKDKDGKTTAPGPKGDALINVRYWTDQFYLPGFYYHRLHMKADVIKFQ